MSLCWWCLLSHLHAAAVIARLTGFVTLLATALHRSVSSICMPCLTPDALIGFGQQRPFGQLGSDQRPESRPFPLLHLAGLRGRRVDEQGDVLFAPGKVGDVLQVGTELSQLVGLLGGWRAGDGRLQGAQTAEELAALEKANLSR